MNSNIITPQVSSEIATPGNLQHTPKCIDLYIVENHCFQIGVEPTDDNLRRMRRAMDLHQKNAVRPFHSDQTPDAYYVRSQSEEKFYIVLPHTGCDCPDAHRLNGSGSYSAAWERINQTGIRCKHEMTVELFKKAEDEKADDEAILHTEAEANQFDDQWDVRFPCG